MYLSLLINPILAAIAMACSLLRDTPPFSTLSMVFFYPIGIASFVVRFIFFIKHS